MSSLAELTDRVEQNLALDRGLEGEVELLQGLARRKMRGPHTPLDSLLLASVYLTSQHSETAPKNINFFQHNSCAFHMNTH